jgi:predicted Rossmann-fold nucleotide-binding protein
MSNNNGHNKDAREAIESFEKRYARHYPNDDHVALIQLAAFPVAVTVHLLYQIWANFGTFLKNGVTVKIHALAVHDCIQSNLFRMTGPDLFEMDASVRQCLLEDLRANRGSQFVKDELAAFLYQYSRHNTQGSAWKNYYDAQQWAAIMEVDENAAAEQILSSLAQELQKKNTSRGLGIVNLIAALEKDNKQFSGLLQKALHKPDTQEEEPEGITSKRIVLTNEAVDGRQPVRINLPPALSNRLKTIVKTDPSATDQKSTDTTNKIYGLFIELGDDLITTAVNEIKDILVEKQYIRAENVSILLPGSENPAADVRDRIDSCLSASIEGDTVIIYARYGAYVTVDAGLTSKGLNELIMSHFPGPTVDVICILEGDSIPGDWYNEEYPTFTLITAGYGINEKSDQSLFKTVLSRSAKDITYAQFYNDLLQEFVKNRTEAGIFNLPHLISAALDWDQQLFSGTTYEAIDEAKKLLSDMGRGPGSENSIIELSEILDEGMREQGREKTMALLQISFLYQQEKEVKCCWLLQKGYDFELVGVAGISSTTASWDHFFDGGGYDGEGAVLGIVYLLFETNSLFIGLGPQLLSGLNPFRLKTIMSICRARRILLYFVVEEACEWEQLDIDEDKLLLGGTIMSDYLTKEGRNSFLKNAYKEIEDMIGREESEKTNVQGKAYGIFVGIDQYMDKQFNLHESVSDARKMIGILANKDLIDPDTANMILDNEATRDNVVSILRERLKTAKREDTILFYFSGHSSNQQTNSALFFHDLDVSSEYTSQAENGILTDIEFNELVKTAPNNPTIILILDTHGGSRHWLDESNPKHYSIMATHLEEKCYELKGIGGMLTEALALCLDKTPRIKYIDLYRSVLDHFLNLAHEGNQWQTPLFVVHKDHWHDIFLPKISDTTVGVFTSQKTYEDLETRDTLQCIYYSQTETGAFTFYNQVKFALYEKRADIEHVSTWSAIDKFFSVRNRFPDMIFIGLRQSMYAYETKYNIEKLLSIADAMQIPVYFIREDESEPDPSVYKTYPLLPADGKPVLSDEAVIKLISELEAVTAPLAAYLKPVAEDYETWGISIGITHYENLPGLPDAVRNVWRFNDWLTGRLKNKVSQENLRTFVTGSDIRINKSDIEDAIRRLVNEGVKVTEKKVLYVYICGYALRNTKEFLLCLAPWSERNGYAVVNITEYIQALSHANFAKVVAFAEYLPVDSTVEGIGRSIIYPSASHPAPSCFFKVELKVDDNPSSEKNSIVLDGLNEEAALNNNTITTSIFTAYINKRSQLAGMAQRPQVYIKDTPEKDFVIATLDPLYTPSNNTEPFKQKWALIVGTGKDRLSQPEWMMSNALARELAKSGYGVITGGWPGVDSVAAEAYAGQLAEDKVIDEGYLQQVVLETQEPVYPGGLIKRVANETVWYDTLFKQAYALIMIGGRGGTYISYENAERANVPAIPIGATGGDAAKAYAELEKRRLLPRHLLDELNRPVNNYDDAERIAAAICKFLDEGMGNNVM